MTEAEWLACDGLRNAAGVPPREDKQLDSSGDRGVPAPRSAFYRIFVDTGAGPEYWGLYTMVEDPGDGAMLDSQLGGRAANLYKPDGPGADWTTFDKEGFSKKTNEDEANFADVEAAFAALQAPRDNPAQWRAKLESVFDVDHFLKWLAVNTAIDNWDTYGAMAHNYYLYGDPKQKGRLQWIPWDNNMAFGINPMGGRLGAPAGPAASGRRAARGGRCSAGTAVRVRWRGARGRRTAAVHGRDDGRPGPAAPQRRRPLAADSEGHGRRRLRRAVSNPSGAGAAGAPSSSRGSRAGPTSCTRW